MPRCDRLHPLDVPTLLYDFCFCNLDGEWGDPNLSTPNIAPPVFNLD